jgi:hypothetical protein
MVVGRIYTVTLFITGSAAINVLIAFSRRRTAARIPSCSRRRGHRLFVTTAVGAHVDIVNILDANMNIDLVVCEEKDGSKVEE